MKEQPRLWYATLRQGSEIKNTVYKGKTTVKEKLRIIEQYLSGKIGCCEAGRQAGVNHRTIAQWASRYIYYLTRRGKAHV